MINNEGLNLEKGRWASRSHSEDGGFDSGALGDRREPSIRIKENVVAKTRQDYERFRNTVVAMLAYSEKHGKVRPLPATSDKELYVLTETMVQILESTISGLRREADRISSNFVGKNSKRRFESQLLPKVRELISVAYEELNPLREIVAIRDRVVTEDKAPSFLNKVTKKLASPPAYAALLGGLLLSPVSGDIKDIGKDDVAALVDRLEDIANSIAGAGANRAYAQEAEEAGEIDYEQVGQAFAENIERAHQIIERALEQWNIDLTEFDPETLGGDGFQEDEVNQEFDLSNPHEGDMFQTSADVQYRYFAGDDQEVLGTFPAGTPVAIDQEPDSSGWVRVENLRTGDKGWVKLETLEHIAPENVPTLTVNEIHVGDNFVTASDAEYKAFASSAEPVAGTFRAGTPVAVITEPEQGMVRVETQDGQRGWVLIESLSPVEENVEPEAAPEPPPIIGVASAEALASMPEALNGNEELVQVVNSQTNGYTEIDVALAGGDFLNAEPRFVFDPATGEWEDTQPFREAYEARFPEIFYNMALQEAAQGATIWFDAGENRYAKEAVDNRGVNVIAYWLPGMTGTPNSEQSYGAGWATKDATSTDDISFFWGLEGRERWTNRDNSVMHSFGFAPFFLEQNEASGGQLYEKLINFLREQLPSELRNHQIVIHWTQDTGAINNRDTGFMSGVGISNRAVGTEVVGNQVIIRLAMNEFALSFVPDDETGVRDFGVGSSLEGILLRWAFPLLHQQRNTPDANYYDIRTSPYTDQGALDTIRNRIGYEFQIFRAISK